VEYLAYKQKAEEELKNLDQEIPDPEGR